MNSCEIRKCQYWNGSNCTDEDLLYEDICRFNSCWSTEEEINKMQELKPKYIYIILCGDTVSGLGFDSFEKAEQWLIKERNCIRMGNDWIYKDKSADRLLWHCFYYKIKEIKIV